MSPPITLMEPRVFHDDRGVFNEVFHSDHDKGIGLTHFQQANVVYNRRGVLRGLHYQHPHAQGKLVTCIQGEIWDVVVDIRRDSPTFKQHWGYTLCGCRRRLWIPPGFAHGYCALGTGESIVLYLCDTPYIESQAQVIWWNDPELHIPWPLQTPILSPKDHCASRLSQIPAEQLPLRFPEATPPPSPVGWDDMLAALRFPESAPPPPAGGWNDVIAALCNLRATVEIDWQQGKPRLVVK